MWIMWVAKLKYWSMGRTDNRWVVDVFVELPFKKGRLRVLVEDDRIAHLVLPVRTEAAHQNPVAVIGNAIHGSQGELYEFLEGANGLLVVINDDTRPTPTKDILARLWEHIGNRKVQIIVAAGLHTHVSPATMKEPLGDFFYRNYAEELLIHDGHVEESLRYHGTTSRGTRVLMNRVLDDHDHVLVIGSVEPHYFAGYSGGPKGISIGLGGLETISNNHKLALQSGSLPLVHSGNPVSEDIMEASAFLDETHSIFSVMTVTDPSTGGLVSCHAGRKWTPMAAARESARQAYGVPITELADIVVAACPFPFDRDLYQSHKAIEHARMALAPGGIMILVSSCARGIGSRVFYDVLASSSNPEDALDYIRSEYRLGYHKTARLASFLLDNELWCISDLEPHTLEEAFIRPFPYIQEAVDEAIAIMEENGRPGRITFFPYAPYTVGIPNGN